jgi:hypothetical protein
MKAKLIVFFGLCFLVLGSSYSAWAQLSPFPGSKTLDSGPDPIGLGKPTSTFFQFTITLNANNFDPSLDLIDTVPAEFDVAAGNLCTAGLVGSACTVNTDCDTSLGSADGICSAPLTPSCGVASSTEGPGSTKGQQPKLNPDHITWDLNGGTACDATTSQTLTVVIVTDQNPGHGKREIPFFEPTSCGPLYLNDGATLVDLTTGEAVTEPSNSLFVASCLLEGDANCVDSDNDGWSVDCGDPDDTNSDITPLDVDGDGSANDVDPCPTDPTNSCV